MEKPIDFYIINIFCSAIFQLTNYLQCNYATIGMNLPYLKILCKHEGDGSFHRNSLSKLKILFDLIDLKRHFIVY